MAKGTAKEHRARRDKPFEKVSRYLFSVSENPKFHRIVGVIREEFEIPKDGYKLTSEEKEMLRNEQYVRKDQDEMPLFDECVWGLCEEFGFDSKNWMTCFRFYVLFGVFQLSEGHEYDLVIVHPYKERDVVRMERAYPVVLRISAYAGLRDIQALIASMYSGQIKPIQEKYAMESVKIGKIREKDELVQERNLFIYEHRHLPRKEIMRLVNDKFVSKNPLDYAYIGKIIGIEIKKRKEV